MQLVYNVINQLRDKLTFDEFIDRVKLAKGTGYKLFYGLIGEKVVGVVGLRILDDLCWGHHLYVDDLVVDESWRNRGIGKKLMKYVENLAYSEQCQYIRLASGISKTEAHKFYKSLGYQTTSFSFALKL
ncbi:hypothetical protein BJP37_13075 [Moorena bouillonii PNG]|uniref:N-acetyltransferase domain-containing protein n=2 Tax=Moorena TaxID=1155738 RepID=A0A1U7NBE5_9CYAN|nr:hypothetical protein BJP37_13075 [Moorena bouillonii PNG]